MSRSLDSAKQFSRKVLPPGWHDVIVSNELSLRLFGKENLEKMLKEWEILHCAYETKVKYLERNGSRDAPLHNLKSAKCDLQTSETAMKILSRAIPKAESAPLFATHRSMFDTFSVGEKVFVVVIEDGYFSPVTIIAIEYENIYVRFDKYEGKPSGKIEYDSPLLQKPDDLKYLIEHLDYARFYACACGLTYAEDVELFVTMLEDCDKRLLPKRKPAIQPSNNP